MNVFIERKVYSELGICGVSKWGSKIQKSAMFFKKFHYWKDPIRNFPSEEIFQKFLIFNAISQIDIALFFFYFIAKCEDYASWVSAVALTWLLRADDRGQFS